LTNVCYSRKGRFYDFPKQEFVNLQESIKQASLKFDHELSYNAVIGNAKHCIYSDLLPSILDSDCETQDHLHSKYEFKGRVYQSEFNPTLSNQGHFFGIAI
jgi:hypothetical protein